MSTGSPASSSNHLNPEQLRALALRHLGDGVFIVSTDDQVVDWNGAAESLLGWTAREVIGGPLSALQQPGARPALSCEFLAGSGGGAWSGLATLLSRSGDCRVCEVAAGRVFGEDGALAAVVVSFRDVTARKAAETAICDERRFLRTLLDQLPDLIFFKDLEGRFLLQNLAHGRLAEGSADFIGRTVFDLPLLREHAARYAADDRRVLESGDPIVNREEAIPKPGGEAGWFLTSKLPVRDPNGSIIGILGIARDITERKEAEKQLVEERQLLRTVIDAVHDPIFLKDCEGRFILQNQAHAQLFGTEGVPIKGRTDRDFAGMREYADIYRTDDLRVLSTGEPVINREEPFVRPTGRSGWFLTSKFPMRDTSGELIGLVGISRDVTEVRAATEALHEERQRVLSHMENSPLGVIEWDPEFRIQRWSPQADAMFGWRGSEAMGRKYDDLCMVHPEDAARVAEAAARLCDGRDQRNVCHNRNLTRDGQIIHCEWHNSAVRRPDGRLISILSFVQNVTERVRAEQVIRESDRLYHTLVDATNTGYVKVDGEGRVLEANAEFVRLTGRKTLKEIVGHSVLEWTAARDIERNAREVAKCVETGYTRGLELDYVGPDGAVIPIEVNSKACATSTGLEIIAFCRDISHRRRVEEDRRAMERRLQETQKLESLGMLAGGIAHDFNNLLAGVMGCATLAATELPDGSPAAEYLGRVEALTMRAGDLCKQMLAYAGKGRFTMENVDANDLIRETAALLQVMISKKAKLHLDLAPATPKVHADATQLRQVVMNLVINASEAIGDQAGEIHVSTRVVPSAPAALDKSGSASEAAERPYLCMEVRDSGCGMPPEVVARIFDPFFTTKFTGRGLGLAAVSGIVRGHRGVLTVESAPGGGSNFQVFLPCELRTESAAGATAPLDHAGRKWKGFGTVLVVDDEKGVRFATARMLRLLGFESIEAEDGRKALDVILSPERAPLSLVTLDLMMPVLNGYETLAEIRRAHPDLPVLVVSGYDENDKVSELDPGGATAFLQKPFSFDHLRDKIRGLLER